MDDELEKNMKELVQLSFNIDVVLREDLPENFDVY
jgi:BMFP domain-containing protein YqiC